MSDFPIYGMGGDKGIGKAGEMISISIRGAQNPSSTCATMAIITVLRSVGVCYDPPRISRAE